jgi:hypothetical protein
MTPLIQIRSVEQLRKHIEFVTGEVCTDEQLIWFNCIHQAHSFSNECTNTREIANIFLEGIKPCNQLSDVQDMLDGIYADYEFEAGEVDKNAETLYLQLEVARHWGKLTLVEQLEAMLGDDE